MEEGRPVNIPAGIDNQMLHISEIPTGIRFGRSSFTIRLVSVRSNTRGNEENTESFALRWISRAQN